MTTYYRDILIDTRTSCSRDESVAIILGRRSVDPIYQDLNPQDDPADVQEQFMGWLDISIFDQLMEERDSVLMELDNAIEGGNGEGVEACRQRIVRCDDTIRRARLISCDVDDELAKGALSQLRIDREATENKGQTYITMSSLRLWKNDPNHNWAVVEASPTQHAPAARHISESEEPLLNAKGGMSPKMTKGFLATFAILYEEYFSVTGKAFMAESGSEPVAERIAKHLCEKSLPRGRAGHFLSGQSVSSIEARIKTVIMASAEALAAARAAEIK